MTEAPAAEQTAGARQDRRSEAGGVISTIHPTLDYAGFDRVDVVVEAVVENPKSKAVPGGNRAESAPKTVLAQQYPPSQLANWQAPPRSPKTFGECTSSTWHYRMPLLKSFAARRVHETIAKARRLASKQNGQDTG